MSLIYQLFEIAATITETAILLDFINKLLESKFDGIKNVIQFAGAFVIINAYMIASSIMINEYSAIADMIGILLYISYTLIFMKSSVIYRVITPVLSVMTILFINLIIVVITSNIFDYIPSEILIIRNTLRIFLLFTTKFIFFILTRIVLKISNPQKIIMNMSEFASISIIFSISVVIVLFSTEIYYNSKFDLDIFLVILIISIAITNIAVFIIFNIISKRNREQIKYSILNAQFNEQKKAHSSVQSIYQNFQILQHDLKNQLLSIYNMIEENKTEEAKQYILDYTETNINKFHEYVRTGNNFIDAIINIKLNIAREKGIDVMCSINSDFTGFDVDDILRLFSNAVDNAIESCQLQTNGQIKVHIRSKCNYLFITVCNTISSSVVKNNSKLKTTKKEKIFHGFGTQSMRYIADKYDGMVDFYENDSMFIADIMLKSSKSS